MRQRRGALLLCRGTACAALSCCRARSSCAALDSIPPPTPCLLALRQVELICGPAAESLAGLLERPGEAGSYDLAFVDADKRGYRAYHEQLLQVGPVIDRVGRLGAGWRVVGGLGRWYGAGVEGRSRRAGETV